MLVADGCWVAGEQDSGVAGRGPVDPCALVPTLKLRHTSGRSAGFGSAEVLLSLAEKAAKPLPDGNFCDCRCPGPTYL